MHFLATAWPRGSVLSKRQGWDSKGLWPFSAAQDDVSAWHQWQWKGAAVHRPSCLFWVVLSGLPVQAALVQNLVLG